MEHLVALPQYDALAYLIVGIAALGLCDWISGSRLFFRQRWTIKTSLAIVIAAYVAGHAAAFVSAIAFDGLFAGGVFERPIAYLMGTPCGKPATISYFSPLECNTQNRIVEKEMTTLHKTLPNNELFWEAYNTAKQDEHAFDRIVTFHQQYNFTRNMSFVLLLAAVAVLLRAFRKEPPLLFATEAELPKQFEHSGWQFALFTIAGAILFARYLYFYRAHTIEILTSYAYGGAH